nr:auxilin-like protein [Tanacetum cinerariifolium]
MGVDHKVDRPIGFTVGHVALKAASCKVTKHDKAYIKNQHVFVPFAFDTFSFLATEAVELLNRVQRVMHSNVMTPVTTRKFQVMAISTILISLDSSEESVGTPSGRFFGLVMAISTILISLDSSEESVGTPSGRFFGL